MKQTGRVVNIAFRIENRDGDPTREELANGHPQVTAISLAPTVSNDEIEQLQQTGRTSIAIARHSVVTGVTFDPLLLETSDLELTRLLTLLPHIEVRGELLKIRGKRIQTESGRCCVQGH